MLKHLRVFHIVRESFKSVRAHKLDWIHVLSTAFFLWIFGLVGMHLIDMSANHYAGLHFSPERHLVIAWQTTPSIVAFGHAFYALCSLLAGTVLYISGYRYALLGEGNRKLFSLENPGRIGKFILYSFLISMAGGVFMGTSILAFFELIRQFTSYGIALACVGLWGVLGLYLFFRLTFVKLLISLDIPRPIRTSWTLLKGNVLRILALNILVTLLFAVIFSLGAALLFLTAFALEYTGINTSLFATLLEREVLLAIGSIFGGLVWIFSWAVLTKAYAIAFQDIAESNA